MKKGSIHQEDIIVNTYASNITVPNIKQILTDLKAEIKSNAIILGDYIVSLSKWVHHRARKSKRHNRLKPSLGQMNLTYTHTIFHPIVVEHTFFSNAHGTFPRIDHKTGHKTSRNTFTKTETMSSIFSENMVYGIVIHNYKLITGEKLENSQICGN